MELLLLILGAGFAVSLSGLGGGGGGTTSGEEPGIGDDGGPGPDLLTGTGFSDEIFGRGGNDTINGGVGEDLLDGNGGNDEVYGDAGDDSLYGGDGNDTLGGATGTDFLRGGAGDDELRGGADNDTLEGANNADSLQGDGGNDVLRGGPGKDYLIGNEGADLMEGGPGDDTMVGITGGFASVPDSSDDGADTLEGGLNSDRIVLGTGDEAWGEFATGAADGAGDTFIIGTWIGVPAATVYDFDPTVDQIQLYYDSGAVADDVPVISSTMLMGDVTYEIAFDGVTRLVLPVGMSGNVVQLSNITLFDIA